MPGGCGAGMQNRSVQCVRDDGRQMEDANCLPIIQGMRSFFYSVIACPLTDFVELLSAMILGPLLCNGFT